MTTGLTRALHSHPHFTSTCISHPCVSLLRNPTLCLAEPRSGPWSPH